MATLQSTIEHVWKPIKGSSQEIALDTRCDETLYCGTRGPGKTDTQLMRFRRHVGLGYGAFWKGIIFDREYKNLEDLIAKSERWFNAFDDGAVFLSSASLLKWVWPTGEELLFRVADNKKDYWKYHGHEYPFIGWNELTKYETPELYDMVMSINRSSYVPENYPVTIDGDEYNNTGQVVLVDPKHKRAKTFILPPIPLEVFSTTNPYGIGHAWVKRRFVDVGPYGKVVKRQVEIIDPKTKETATVTKTQVAIFGSYVENIYLDAKYIATLNEEKDPNRKKAWLMGSWDIVAGGALDDVWNKNVHVVPRFVVPASWRLDRSFDDGSSHPFSVGWWAQANGEEATIVVGGVEYSFCPQAGSLIQFYEWYGTEEIGTNKGLKLSATKIAIGIIERETALIEGGWIDEQPWPGPADNRIRAVVDSELDTPEKLMNKQGVRWEESDKSPGSRLVGLALVRDRLEAAVKGEGPALYFMDNCVASIATLPLLPRDSKRIDDVDTKSEDHPYDMVRYRVLKGANRLAHKIKVSMPT